MNMGRGHGEHGEVCSVGDDYSSKGKRVRVTVKHGVRKPAKKTGSKNVVAHGDYDDRPESTFSIPRAKAHHYPVGKKVRVALHPQRPKKKQQQSEDDAVDDMYGGKAL